MGVPTLGPYSIGPADPEVVIDAEAKRRPRDLLADMLAAWLFNSCQSSGSDPAAQGLRRDAGYPAGHLDGQITIGIMGMVTAGHHRRG